MKQAFVSGLANGGIYGLLAVGIVLVYKGTRVLNFAQGELGTFALFITWTFVERLGQPWIVGAVAATAAVGLIGAGFERLVVRRMEDATRLAIAVATAGLLLLLIALELKLWGPSPKALDSPLEGGFELAGFFLTPIHLLALGATITIGLALALFLTRTDFGLGVLAASQDPAAARLMGVPLGKVSAFTWITAGVVGSIAALLVQPTIGAFTFGFMTLLFIRGLAAALLGGLTSLPGAFIGGLLIGVVEAVVGQQFVQSTFPGIKEVTMMIVILAILLIRPQGLLGKEAV